MPAKLRFGIADYSAYLGYSAYACCAMVFSITLASIALSLDFPLSEGNNGAGGALHFWRSISMAVMMLSCIFITGRFGKRRSVGWALTVIGLGIAAASFAGNYYFLLGCVIFSALGQGVFEVLITPMVKDLHRNDINAPRYINITHAFWSIGVVCVVLCGGILLSCEISWRVILLICGTLAILPGISFLMQKKNQCIPDTPIPPSETWKNICGVLKIRRFWLFLACMFLAGGVEHCLIFWIPSYLKEEFSRPDVLCAVGSGCFAVGMVCGRLASGFFGNGKIMHKIIFLSTAGGILLGIIPVFCHNLYLLFAILFILGISTGPLWPSIQNYCISRIPNDPETMLVFLPCIGIPGCGFFTYLMGTAADHWNRRYSFFLIPLCNLLLLLLIAAERSFSERKNQKDKSDHVKIQ